MELSYEETMRRINEYEQNDPSGYKFCKEKSFPWDVSVFKGENQIIVVPYITSIGCYSVLMAWHRILREDELPGTIGQAILDAFEHIRLSPVDARTQAERKADAFYLKATKCKSYQAFNRKYLCCSVSMNEQEIFRVSAFTSTNGNQGYGRIDGSEAVTLSAGASPDDIGNVVLSALKRSEEYQNSQKPDRYPPVEVELLSGKRVEITPPRDKHFTDMGDGHAAEIYRLFEYVAKDGADPSAVFYLGIAAELDCDMSEDNIRNSWEKLHDKVESFEVRSGEYGIFKLRAEMKNKSVHRVSYILQIDGSELLDCTMELYKPNSRKMLDEKISILFEELAYRCKLKD